MIFQQTYLRRDPPTWPEPAQRALVEMGGREEEGGLLLSGRGSALVRTCWPSAPVAADRPCCMRWRAVCSASVASMAICSCRSNSSSPRRTLQVRMDPVDKPLIQTAFYAHELLLTVLALLWTQWTSLWLELASMFMNYKGLYGPCGQANINNIPLCTHTPHTHNPKQMAAWPPAKGQAGGCTVTHHITSLTS